MKRVFFFLLVIFASVNLHAGTSAPVNVVHSQPQPDFLYFARPYGNPLPGITLTAFAVAIPTSADADLVSSYSWDFGDGTLLTTTDRLVNHGYATVAGTFIVTLTVTYVSGEITTVTKTVVID